MNPMNSAVIEPMIKTKDKAVSDNSNKGDMVVLDPTREAKEVAKNKFKEGSGATPVFSGKDMFLRDGERLYCIGE